MSKKIITIIIAAAMLASSAINAFAVGNTSNNSFNVSAQTYTTMSATDKEKFINDNLDVKLQHMSSLVTLTANGDYNKIAEEVKNALDSGLTATEIKESIYHSGAYCGFTRAAKALDAADTALKALGQDITYSSRITSSEDVRYDEGLATQRYLFGQQIGTITDDMDGALKL